MDCTSTVTPSWEEVLGLHLHGTDLPPRPPREAHRPRPCGRRSHHHAHLGTLDGGTVGVHHVELQRAPVLGLGKKPEAQPLGAHPLRIDIHHELLGAKAGCFHPHDALAGKQDGGQRPVLVKSKTLGRRHGRKHLYSGLWQRTASPPDLNLHLTERRLELDALGRNVSRERQHRHAQGAGLEVGRRQLHLLDALGQAVQAQGSIRLHEAEVHSIHAHAGPRHGQAVEVHHPQHQDPIAGGRRQHHRPQGRAGAGQDVAGHRARGLHHHGVLVVGKGDAGLAGVARSCWKGGAAGQRRRGVQSPAVQAHRTHTDAVRHCIHRVAKHRRSRQVAHACNQPWVGIARRTGGGEADQSQGFQAVAHPPPHAGAQLTEVERFRLPRIRRAERTARQALPQQLPGARSPRIPQPSHRRRGHR